MAGEIVVVLGAGATKACEGPLTNEILPWAFANAGAIEREDYIALAARFIEDVFGVNPHNAPPDRLPPLTLILSLVDLALDRREAIGVRWQAVNPYSPPDLSHVRHAFDYLIFAVLELHLMRITHNPHVELLSRIREAVGEAHVISLNYDIIADNSFIRMGERYNQRGFPDYGTEIASDFYRERDVRVGRLLKLHGSLNWMYCPNCHRLDLGLSAGGRYTEKLLAELYQARPGEETLEHRYTCHGSPCVDCKTWVRPVLISPSFQKDYRNPHIAAIWRQADSMLRKAKRVIFIGYSLPEDDIHVVYLLKRAAGHLRDGAVTVIEHDPDQLRPASANPVGRRYMWLFGDGIDWHPESFVPWLATAKFKA